jgi:hypothetical protein
MEGWSVWGGFVAAPAMFCVWRLLANVVRIPVASAVVRGVDTDHRTALMQLLAVFPLALIITLAGVLTLPNPAWLFVGQFGWLGLIMLCLGDGRQGKAGLLILPIALLCLVGAALWLIAISRPHSSLLVGFGCVILCKFLRHTIPSLLAVIPEADHRGRWMIKLFDEFRTFTMMSLASAILILLLRI